MSRYVWDIEASDLLNHRSIDYTASPYQLKDDYKFHCVVFHDVDTAEEVEFIGTDIKRVKEFVLDTATELIAHNSISYDHTAMKAGFGMDFDIGVYDGEPGEFYTLRQDSICGKPITITDTLVLSKTLNPDRMQHSIDFFGKILGLEKIDWRAKAVELGLIEANAPRGAEFKVYHPEMLTYCKRDVQVNVKVWKMLLKEWGKWNWADAYSLEKATAEIIVRQEHRGFWFDSDKAGVLVRDLDVKMEALRKIVEPLIPPKPIGKTAAKEFIPPKIQFKKNGEPSALIQKWIEKHGGSLDRTLEDDGWCTQLFDTYYKLPMPLEPIKTHVEAKINDTTHIKGWLKELGWKPSQYKERDLTVDSKKKKLSREQYEAACARYVEQTMESPFKQDRLDHLDITSAKLAQRLAAHDWEKRPLKVYTNPTLTVGMEKEVDPALLALSDKFAYSKEVSNYLTYSHRRNSILGGGIDPDDFDEDDEFSGKGWLAVERLEQDHRIPTPADTCGAATSRFKHRVVVNVPRVTSLYGGEMRSLFGVDLSAGMVQLGYDFASLESRIQAHYTWRYDEEDKAYCNSLIQEKPNDIHSITAKKVSAAIGQEFGRTPAKNVAYACAYGARPARVAKTVGCSLELGERIFNAFWDAAKPLALLNENLKKYWTSTGGKKFILGIDGRKIPTRSESALINSLFQSAGVICAKKTMVLHDRLLRQNGLIVDFWRDDWKNAVFAQQLIAMHDEAQLETAKSLVKWKMFKTEGDAKDWKSKNEGWSAIGHSERGYYVAKSIVTDLVEAAVTATSEHFGLKVPLAVEYIAGRNWAECH
jgi:DNA polymerase I-like protein with 3'-5' exonuclease and polymerase domains